MGHLILIVLALGAQALAEAGARTGWRAPLGVLLLGLLPHALGRLSRGLFLKGRFRASALVARALDGASPALHFAAFALFGWGESLEGWLGAPISLLAWPRAGLLAAVAPFAVYELLAIDARARAADSPGPELRSWRAFQARMLLSGLLPFAAYVLFSAAVGLSEELRASIEEVGLYGAAFALAMVVFLGALLPALVRRAWSTAPLPPGASRDALLAVAARARFRCRALLVWNTGNLMANAAILGVGARHRVVLFSDLLLAQLPPRELAAVFAHEIGHAARRHVLVFAVWTLGFLLAADLVASRLLPDDPWLSGAAILVALAIGYRGFGRLSRRAELEADLYSLDLLGDPLALVSALEHVGGRFRDLASWRHFSTADRVSFLARATADPTVARALRRDLRRWTLLGCGLLALAAALQLAAIAGTFSADRVRLDLRLGRFASAVGRAADARDLDPELLALVARVRAIGRDGESADDLERRAERARADGDEAAAREWLDLAALRGDDGWTPRPKPAPVGPRPAPGQ